MIKDAQIVLHSPCLSFAIKRNHSAPLVVSIVGKHLIEKRLALMYNKLEGMGGGGFLMLPLSQQQHGRGRGEQCSRE